MRIWAKIKDAWPLVTKARFNRLKDDRDALLEQHKKMSDYVLVVSYRAEEVAKILANCETTLKNIHFD